MPNFAFDPDDDDAEGDTVLSSSPATPLRGGGASRGGGLFHFDNGGGGGGGGGGFGQSTPGRQPPSSAASFTPAGAPSASYLGSSMMRGMTTGPASAKAAPVPAAGAARNIFGGSSGNTRQSPRNAPLGRSIQGGSGPKGASAMRQPSRLSQVMADDDDDEEEEEEEGEGADEEEYEEEDAEGEADDDNYTPPRSMAAVRGGDSSEEEEEEEEEEGEEEEEEEEDGGDGDGDPWLDLAAQSAAATRGSTAASLQGRAPWMPAENDGGSVDGGEADGDDYTMAGANVGLGPADGDDMDGADNLMLFSTFAADDRVLKEAEDIYRVSVARGGSVGAGSAYGGPAGAASSIGAAARRGPREYRYASIAKSMYRQMGYAAVVEAPELIRETEMQISRLYAQGIGTEDDPDRLDQVLADVSGQLVGLWQAYAESLPPVAASSGGFGDSEDEADPVVSIGPGPKASAFEKAAFVATLALQLHHTRTTTESPGGDSGLSGPEPLTETLFRWMADYHNLYPDQVSEVMQCRPGAASHGLFWQTVFVCLLQGRVEDALALLRAGGWDTVRRAGIPAYTGRALSNVEWAVQETVAMLETCPGRTGHWDVWSGEWTLFRIRARGALDQLRRFAEGRGGGGAGGEDSQADNSGYGGGRHSMAGLARKAESQVPWDIYENINIVFDIALGSRERILAVSQDWCEAALGLFGWWDETKGQHGGVGGGGGGAGFGGSTTGAAHRHGKSLSLSLSLSLAAAQQQQQRADAQTASTFEGYVDRLARAFRATTDAGLEINANNAVEVAVACVLEDNPRGLIGLLRAWSLPVAAAVVEIAALGGWLPAESPTSVLAAALGGDLDMEDLEVLGVDPTDPDEADGFKDNTLVQYAQALVNDEALAHAAAAAAAAADDGGNDDSASPLTMDGWELAVHVLGRMDSSERAEDTIGELVRTMLKTLDVGSGATVDKIWRVLGDLGLSSYAEEAAEHYGDLLTNESYRFGEAVWYYAVAHRPAKVREVMNLLTSYSLIQSAAYPAAADLDDHLRRLLTERGATLAQLARRDLDAAEVLGRMLSGYATLRQFYEVRDDVRVPLARRRATAAVALTAVIASADDNVRGGLYDGTRDAVVSEDFLLALLGEALVLTEAAPGPGPGPGPGPRTYAALVSAPPVVTAETIDTLLKAVEDVQTLAAASSRVYAACDDFFQVVLASAPGGLKGSTPADLVRTTSGASSFVLTGSSMLASQLHRSMAGGGGGGGGGGGRLPATTTATKPRGWDWRSGLTAHATAADVLQRLRQGLSRALAQLWVAEVDGLVGGGPARPTGASAATAASRSLVLQRGL